MDGWIGKHERLIGKAGELDVWWDDLDGRQTQEEKEEEELKKYIIFMYILYGSLIWITKHFYISFEHVLELNKADLNILKSMISGYRD